MQDASVPRILGILRIAALPVLVFLIFPFTTAAKTLMIFAPHPDDEALMASGIMYSALSRGDTVKVVLMTNGDAGGPVPGTTLGTEFPTFFWPISAVYSGPPWDVVV